MVETVVTEDIRTAVMELCDEDDIDTIVVGPRGHHALHQSNLGSFSLFLASHATRPVVLVRAPRVDDKSMKKAITRRISQEHE